MTKLLLKKLWTSLTDLMPIILVVFFFQAFVIQQGIPQAWDLLIGGIMVVAGLMLFVEGLEMGLFPLGETLAYALAKKGSLFWLMVFSFFLGFSTTIAEPALIAIADEAAEITSGAGLIQDEESIKNRYALGLRISVALSVGAAIVVGVLRILKGWSLVVMIVGGYALVLLVTVIAPREILGLAYDAGGVTTSTITVPLVTALGVGLSNSIKGRNPLTDGFGLVAFASLFPMIFVMLYGLIWFG